MSKQKILEIIFSERNYFQRPAKKNSVDANLGAHVNKTLEHVNKILTHVNKILAHIL